MFCCTTWLIAFLLSCSGAPAENDKLDFHILRDLTWDPSRQTSQHMDINRKYSSNSQLDLHRFSTNDIASSNTNDESETKDMSMAKMEMLSNRHAPQASSELEDFVKLSPALGGGIGDPAQASSADHLFDRPISGSGLPQGITSEQAQMSSSTETGASTAGSGETSEQPARTDAGDQSAPEDSAVESSAPSVRGAGQLPVSPGGGDSVTGHSRHRPEPGLAPIERRTSSAPRQESRSKPGEGVPAPPLSSETGSKESDSSHSSRRTGVPDLEMLESPSKPRKGAPESGLAAPDSGHSSRRTGVPDLEMIENPSKPRKGAPELELAPPDSGHSSRRTGVPDLEMLESPSKPRKGAPELELAPPDSGHSSRRTGVPDLEMLESPSKPRKGAPESEVAAPDSGHSSRRTGVPDLEMLESPSKPRKGAPESEVAAPDSGHSSRRTGVPDLEMLESPSKPRKGTPEPPPALLLDVDSAAAAAGRGAPDVTVASRPDGEPTESAADPTESAETLREAAAMTNLAKARAAVTVGATFGVLSLLVIAWYGVRRLTDSWQHRHYRKMDFLVDGMYNM